jgi:BON domain
MVMDRDELGVIREALDAEDRVDASRIDLEVRGNAVVLQGLVAAPDESIAAEIIVGEFADKVINELRVDEGSREGIAAPADVEVAVPAENEVLIGSTDMLAGPDAEITSDMAEAFAENEPWDPPDAPSMGLTASEQVSHLSGGDASEHSGEDPDADSVERSDFSLPDLTQQDLEAAARGEPVAALDPDAVAPPPQPEPDPLGVDAFGNEPPEGVTPAVRPVAGSDKGIGATGEGTVGGTGISGTPATETGAEGADTASADPARSATGSTAKGTGTERGPQAPEDPPLREDFPSSD